MQNPLKRNQRPSAPGVFPSGNEFYEPYVDQPPAYPYDAPYESTGYPTEPVTWDYYDAPAWEEYHYNKSIQRGSPQRAGSTSNVQVVRPPKAASVGMKAPAATANSTPLPLLFNKALHGSSAWDIRTDARAATTFRIRDLEPTPATPGDMTCPKLSLAFLCVDAQKMFELSPSALDVEMVALAERIAGCHKRFAHVHTLVHLTYGGDTTLFLRTQFLLSTFSSGLTPQFHPVHSAREVFDVVSSIARAAAPIAQAKVAAIVNSMPEMDITAQSNWLPMIAMMSGGPGKLKMHDCFVIQEGLETFSRLAAATVSQLRDCSLDRTTAIGVRAFFEEETVA
ncbi:hypothetical protein HK104_009802 [Borealophlyctis nickersoniae]|nr:hypothetical protein HK104_009802 [Borealophlyctis nickersoniae]